MKLTHSPNQYKIFTHYDVKVVALRTPDVSRTVNLSFHIFSPSVKKKKKAKHHNSEVLQWNAAFPNEINNKYSLN